MIQTILNKEVYVYGLVFILTFCVFGNTILNERALDDEYIFNTLEQMPEDAGIRDIFNSRYNNVDYRPIAVATFYLEKVAGINNIHVSHFINVLLYAILNLLIYLTISRLRIPHAKYIAFLACLIFIVHPSHSNVVASLKSRDGILSAMFGMSALYFFVLALSSKRLLLLLFVPILLFLGILSKLDALVFIGLIPLTYIFFFLERKLNLAFMKKIAVLALFTFLLYQLVELRRDIKDSTITEEITVDGETVSSVDFQENPIVTSSNNSDLVAYGIQTSLKYIAFMIKPYGYWFYFGYNTAPIKSIGDPIVIGGVFLHILLFVFFIYGFFKKSIIAFGIAFYFIAIFPFLNIAQPVAGIFAVRYAFIASIGFAIILSGILCRVYFDHTFSFGGKEYHVNSGWAKKSVLISTITIVIICGAFAFQRNTIWKDKPTLFMNDIDHLTNSFNANFIVGSYFLELYETKPTKRNLQTLEKALKYFKRAEDVYSENSQNYAQMGLVNYHFGDRKAAKESWLRSIELEPRNFKTLMLLSDFYLQEKKPDLAERYLLQALDVNINVQKSGMYFKLTNLYNSIGKHEEALQLNKERLLEDSVNYVLYQNLGNTYLFLNDTTTAVEHFQRSLDLGLDAPLLEKQLEEYYNKQ